MIVTRFTKQGFDAILEAKFDEIDSVCSAVEEFLDHHQLQIITFDIILGIREAMTNAIRHGSKLDPTKKVYFSIIRQGSMLNMTIADQGPGFNWREVTTSCAPDFDESGRGICILYHYFDAVLFNDLGNELLLSKKLNCVRLNGVKN